MLSTYKNYTININQLQVFLTNNQAIIGFSEMQLEKIIKTIRKYDTTSEMRNILYKSCLNKIEINKNEFNDTNLFKHLNLKDRYVIEMFYTSKFNESFIATFLNKDRSTINREIARGLIVYENLTSLKSYKKGMQYIEFYSANEGQKKYDLNRVKSRKPFKLEKDLKLAEAVKSLLEGLEKDENGAKIKLSPDIIANYSKQHLILETKTTICSSTIYNSAHRRIAGLTINSLPFGRKYYKPNKYKKVESEKTVNKKDRISIEDMPIEIKENKVITHFQGDSVIGQRNGKNNTVLTFANPANQFVIVMRSENKTAESTVKILDKLEYTIPNLNEIMQSLLLDNGTEFSRINEMKRSVKGDKDRFVIYFAHAYASYERGCNENKNRMIRKYIPKGKLIENYTDKEIFNISVKINNLPRKKLNYKTPLQLYREQLKQAGINSDFLDAYEITISKYLVA